MKLTCVTCNKEFNSLIVDKVMAWNECYTKLINHTMKRHPEVIATLQVEIQKAIGSLTSYLTVTRLAQVPEDEVYLNLLVDEFQRDIMVAAGFEEDDELEEDENQEKGEAKDVDKEYIAVTDATNVDNA
jgi:hypothetical protein